MPQSQSDFIKSLFINLNEKVDQLQTKDDAKILEERLLSEIKDIKDLYLEQQKTILEHKGYFNTIKIFATTGVASLIAFYSWIISLVDKK